MSARAAPHILPTENIGLIPSESLHPILQEALDESQVDRDRLPAVATLTTSDSSSWSISRYELSRFRTLAALADDGESAAPLDQNFPLVQSARFVAPIVRWVRLDRDKPFRFRALRRSEDMFGRRMHHVIVELVPDKFVSEFTHDDVGSIVGFRERIDRSKIMDINVVVPRPSLRFVLGPGIRKGPDKEQSHVHKDVSEHVDFFNDLAELTWEKYAPHPELRSCPRINLHKLDQIRQAADQLGVFRFVLALDAYVWDMQRDKSIRFRRWTTRQPLVDTDTSEFNIVRWMQRCEEPEDPFSYLSRLEQALEHGDGSIEVPDGVSLGMVRNERVLWEERVAQGRMEWGEAFSTDEPASTVPVDDLFFESEDESDSGHLECGNRRTEIQQRSGRTR